MDTDHPRRMTGRPGRRRRRRRVDIVAASILGVTIVGSMFAIAGPATAADLAPEASLPGLLSSLPVEQSSLPVPTVVLPTPLPTPIPTPRPTPLPTLPLPTDQLPTLSPLPSIVPTPSLPTPSLPTPTLPLPTTTPTATPAGESASPAAPRSPGSTGPPGAGTFLGGPGPIGSPSLTSPDDVSPASSEAPSVGGPAAGPLESIVLPGLLIGVPTILVLAALLAQLAVGVAWLPVIRKWLHRRIV